jgi:hypothetical protein
MITATEGETSVGFCGPALMCRNAKRHLLLHPAGGGHRLDLLDRGLAMSGMQPAAQDDGPLNVLPHRYDRDSSLLETDLVAVAQRLPGAKEVIAQDNDK